MSDSDSFIEEVSEEIRRDRLFRMFRRYGWIAVLLVLVLVAGAGIREYRAAKARAEAERIGDAILAAFETGDRSAQQDALAAIDAGGAPDALVGLLAAGTVLPDDREAAAANLQAIADNTELPRRFRDLAALKRLMILAADIAPEARMTELSALTTPGAPYRLLAEEQMALAEVELGRIDDAVARLDAIAADQEASPTLRRRAADLVVALGRSPGESG